MFDSAKQRIKEMEGSVKVMDKSKKRLITVSLLLVGVFVGAAMFMLWRSYQDVSLVLVSQSVCSEMSNRNVPVSPGATADEPCSIDHVDVDLISALVGSKYKADRGGVAFDIKKSLVARVK
jgi:hypothetical protein